MSASRIESKDAPERKDDDRCRGEDGWIDKDRRYRKCKGDDGPARRRREFERLNDKGTRTYSPWLLIRYAANDIGFRPIPSGAVYWKSPDIWVESSDPMGNGVAGEANFVHARVFNLGMAPSTSTRVDFYWADPSVGLAAQHMNLIGTEWVSIDPHTAVDVRCNKAWVPVFVNNGHECLKVNSTNMAFDPVQYPFQPKVDRHAGQKNITVLENAAEEMDFHLVINNLLALPMEVEVTAQVAHVRADPRLVERLDPRELVARVAAFGALPRLTTREMAARFRKGAPDYRRARFMARYLGGGHDEALRFDDGLERVDERRRAGTKLAGEWGEGGRIVAPEGQGLDTLASFLAQGQLAPEAVTGPSKIAQRLGAIGLKPHEQRDFRLRFQAPATLTRNGFLTIDVAQWAAGVLIGGYTIVVRGR